MSKSREYSSTDIELGRLPPVDLTQGKEPDIIITADVGLKQGELSELAFNEEVLTIRLERSVDSSLSNIVTVTVNGEQVYIPVGRLVSIKRKFVEALARAVKTRITTEVGKIGDDDKNIAHRNTFSVYPFTVVEDKNPRGFDWLTRIQAY